MMVTYEYVIQEFEEIRDLFLEVSKAGLYDFTKPSLLRNFIRNLYMQNDFKFKFNFLKNR